MEFLLMLLWICFKEVLKRYWFVWLTTTVIGAVLCYDRHWLGPTVLLLEIGAMMLMAWLLASSGWN